MPIVNVFGGIEPRNSEHILDVNMAIKAQDVKLRNGKIEPWREKKKLVFTNKDAVSFQSLDCILLSWNKLITVCDYVRDFGRFFITGRSNTPETFIVKDGIPYYFNLGNPAPTIAPTISAGQSDGRTSSSRSYVYTYLNIFNEESAPSPSSISITVADGTPVLVSNLVQPPVSQNIKKIIVYRTATAFREGSEKVQTPLTDLLKVVELPVSQNSFTDTVKERNLGMVCETRGHMPPPTNLRLIRYIRGTGKLSGVTNNKVLFSAPYQPHNWLECEELTLPYNIINHVTMDGVIYVTTDAHPYIITNVKSCDDRKEKVVIPIVNGLPDIACSYYNSAISTPYGMVYVAKDGLVLLSANGEFNILTAPWYSTDDWVRLRPETSRLCYWRGYIICVTDVVSFMLDIDYNKFGDSSKGVLTTISDRPIAMTVSDNGELLLLEDNIIYQWDAENFYRTYEWISVYFNFGGMASPVSAKVKSNDTMFYLYTPMENLFFNRPVTDDLPFRLKRLGRHYNYRIGFKGIGTVEYVDIGTSHTTVNRGV